LKEIMTPSSFSAVAIVLIAQGLAAPAEAGPKDLAMLRAAIATHVLPCGAAFPHNLKRAELLAAFGAAEMTTKKVFGAEGEGDPREDVVLFGGKPADRIQIAWKDDKTGSVESLSVAAGSKWRGPGDIHIGSTVQELEKVNGKTFTFHGLGWDYGGVYDWSHGLLDGKPDGCAVNIDFDANPTASKSATHKIEGEHKFESGDPTLRAANPIAVAITVHG
jgi:hypothetical protein